MWRLGAEPFGFPVQLTMSIPRWISSTVRKYVLSPFECLTISKSSAAQVLAFGSVNDEVSRSPVSGLFVPAGAGRRNFG